MKTKKKRIISPDRKLLSKPLTVRDIIKDKENQIRLLSDYLKVEKHGFRRLFIEMEIKAIERDLKFYKTMHSGQTVYFGTMILESALNY